MKIYKIDHYEYNVDIFRPVYAGTMDAVKEILRQQSASIREQLIVDEMELATTKDALVSALNGNPETTQLRSWKVTARGGLRSLEL